MKRVIAFIVALGVLLGSAFADSLLLPIDLSPGAPYEGKYVPGTEQVYEDPTIRVERYRVDRSVSKWTCTYYYAIITLTDASQLRTYPADGEDFCSNTKIPVNKLAKRTNAILAINGDFPATFSGNTSNTYVLRQGQLYRDTVEPGLDMLIIDEDGDFHIFTRDDDLVGMDKTQVNGKKAINVFQFGPGLVIDGQKVDDESLLDQRHSPAYAHPHQREQRMVIAQIDTLKYMTLCVSNWGADLPTMRDLAMSIADCRNVFVLDGGNSTQMAFLGTICNNMENNKDPRKIADIIYFASADFKD